MFKAMLHQMGNDIYILSIVVIQMLRKKKMIQKFVFCKQINETIVIFLPFENVFASYPYRHFHSYCQGTDTETNEMIINFVRI